MVDIHIRDISDQPKRAAVVQEILAKIGKKKLVFTVQPGPGDGSRSSAPLHRLEYFGDYRGAVNYHGESYSHHFTTRNDEFEIEVTSYVELRWGRYGPPYGEDWVVDDTRAPAGMGAYYRKQFFAGEGRIWRVVLKTSDLINITAQASVEPVVVLKEIGAS